MGRRAGLAGLEEPPLPDALPPLPAESTIIARSRGTRQAMWDLAGVERDRERLERLLGDPHPLARMVAASALAREESRGAHLRVDFPALDSALDGMHAVVRGDDAPLLERWR